MKLLGLIGGVSPESTAIYYRFLNDGARARLGREHSANILLYALDYGIMIRHYDARDWPVFIAEVVNGAKHLADAGADALVICSNTTHVAALAAAEATGLPVIHMLDALAAAMTDAGCKKPLLLGTPVVMSGEYYLPALAERYDGEAVVPDGPDGDEIGRIILDELVNGDVKEDSRKNLQTMIGLHKAAGVDGVILGCTELCMILSQDDCDLPVFDTTALHAAAASAFAFGES